MSQVRFISGDEAFALGVSLARVQVISAYPITPQTIVVERLADMVEEGELDSKFVHVESEHSAMMTAMGVSAMGARAFTATSSQGLLYMAECLGYVSGGRFPIVMMNANRATALPWSIYGDHRDSLSQLDCGWIQIYVEDAQEALDMAIQGYALAESENIRLPVMVNLDGFVLTHTYEKVNIPDRETIDAFLPKRNTWDKLDLDNPVSMAFTVGPELNEEFNLLHHKASINALGELARIDKEYAKITGRSYGNAVKGYRTEDAEYVLISLGSISGLVRDAVDRLRKEGIKAGAIKIRMMRPFPKDEIAALTKNVLAIGVIDKDISFGYEGTVYTNVNSALLQKKIYIPSYNFIGGIGGRDVSVDNIESCFKEMINADTKETVRFMGLEVIDDC
ncbi:MAG: pyruvate ferredoxin oxidoreductase [Lachnospiraceae bacterium]|nr:pyruvate ferredoxin oxidoreductase [Lachnospiraceae bacterium]